MFDQFLFIGLPYLAISILIIGSVVRYKIKAFSYSSLSTQFLEDRWLAWASMPWHIGISGVLLGHFAAFLFPGVWSSIVSYRLVLLLIETVGLLCSLLCLFALVIFLLRRFVDARLQAVTSVMDILALLILLFQVASGLAVALLHPWGAAWAPGSLGPYLSGIFTFKPSAAFLQDMPPFIKTHVAMAWILLALFPFTRLVHALVIPIHYFFRSPQRVVWNATHSQRRFESHYEADNERRVFLKAALGGGAALLLLSMGTLDKFFRYFLRQDLKEEEKSHLLSQKLSRLKQTSEERELQLERMKKSSIFVAKLSELSRTRGKYFIDYHMRPALAFIDENGLPIVISAKCTHLGCTVGQTTDELGRILCPCHISYFDLKTGQPNEGSPAKAPLPHLAWAIKEEGGSWLVRQDAFGKREGSATPIQLQSSMLFIIKDVG